MPEALSILEDFLAEGTAEATAEGETALTAVTGDNPGNVAVETPAAVEEKQKKTPSKAKKAVAAAVPSLSDVPVPKGGVGIMLAIGLLIVFAIVPAPGQSITRLALIWKAITGQATLGDGTASNATHTPSGMPSIPTIQGIYDGPTT